MKKTDSVAVVNRISTALEKQGVRLKRMQILQIAASALGIRSANEMAAADAAGELKPPKAQQVDCVHVDGIGWMRIIRDADGALFGVDRDRFDAMTGRNANWIVSPFGGLLDVTDIRNETPADRDAKPRTEVGSTADRDGIILMTNACCEIAAVDRHDMERLGLSYGSFDGEFYPLTSEENEYIADDVTVSSDGLRTALMGYSVIHRRRKYLMPTIEMPVGAAYDAGSRAEVIAEARLYASRIAAKVDKFSGMVMIDDSMDDRIGIGIMVPFHMAMATGDYDAWSDKLAWMMVDTRLPTVQDGRYPMRIEGERFAVEVNWIGEGIEGDYDPNDDEDHPMLRFDTQRRTDTGWEEIDHGSYCTQIRAYCDRKIAEGLMRHVHAMLMRTEDENPSRMLGLLSWLDENGVRKTMTSHATKEDPPADDGDYVAHETYGDPDRGTSIDLRRRRDGSVRCEVYVDLNCAAVFEGEDMAAVRTFLKTLECDQENADGRPLPSVALAPQWDTLDVTSVRWMLVHAGEREELWFADTDESAPFERRFIPIDEMTV